MLFHSQRIDLISQERVDGISTQEGREESLAQMCRERESLSSPRTQAFSSQSDFLKCEPMNFSNVVALGQSLVAFFADRDYPSLAFLLPTIGLLLKLESNERSEKLEIYCPASSLEWALYSPTNTIPQLQHATSTIRIGKRMRVALALGDVAGSIVIGSVMVHFGEGLDWIDSFYLSDVTTVGYGDYA